MFSRNQKNTPDNETGIECVYKTPELISTLGTTTLQLDTTLKFLDLATESYSLATLDQSLLDNLTRPLSFDIILAKPENGNTDYFSINNINPVIVNQYNPTAQREAALDSVLPSSIRNSLNQILATAQSPINTHFAAGANPNTFYGDMHGVAHHQPQTQQQAYQHAVDRTEQEGDTDTESNGYDSGPGF